MAYVRTAEETPMLSITQILINAPVGQVSDGANLPIPSNASLLFRADPTFPMEPSPPILFARASTQLLPNFAPPATTTKALSFFQVSTPVSTAHRSAMLPQETLFPTVVNAELASFGILPPSTVSLRLALLEDYSTL
jgi:hypothetical protein